MGTPPIQFPTDHSTDELTRGPQQERLPEAAPATGAAPDPDNPPWGFLEALGLLIISFVLMLLTAAAFLIPYTIYHGVGLAAFNEFVSKDPGALLMQVLSILPAHLMTLGLAWVIVTRAGKRPFFRTLGWEWRAGFTFWRSVGLAILLYLVGIALIWLVPAPSTDNALTQLLRSSRATTLAVAFIASVSAPLVEEVVFRGVFYSALQRLVGAAGAVAFVVLIFAGIHFFQYWPSYGVIATIVLLSLALTLIRARTGQLLPCFIVHLVFNFIQGVLLVFEPYLKQLWPDKPVPVPAPAPGLLVELFARLFAGG